MGKEIKRFFSNDRKVSKLIFNLLIVGVVVLIAGSGVFAYFKREAADNQFGYGYGYGFDGTTYGYGYGYGYGALISGNEDYGFWGADGKATGVGVTAKTENSLTIGYTTSYTAKNRIEYGTTTTSLTSSSSWSGYEASGTHSINVTGLSASATYYYKVATQDVGGNVWYSTATYETATTTAAGVVTVTSSAVASTTSVSVGGATTTVSGMFTNLGVTAISFSQATLATAVTSTVSVTGLTGTVSMDIPAGTVIYAATGTFTSIPAPSVDTNYTSASSLTVSGSNYNPIGKVVEFGISGVSLIFDKIVTVTIPDVTETPDKVIYSVGGTTWTEISQCNASDITSTATSSLTFPGACFGYNASTDIITLKTYHFTKFAGVKAITTTTTTTGGGGGGGSNVNPPSISGITVTVADIYATIQWQTSASSLTWLLYGTSTAYGSEIKTTTSTASHSITLTGLSPSTAYHYQIKSKDISGNIGSYTDKTFTTLALGEQPKVIEGPITKPITEMTTAELRAEISRIAALISQLRTQLAKISPAPAGIPAGFTFAKNLSAGMSNSDVVYLKKVLDVEVPDHAKWTGTKKFGSKVKAAVVKFQKKYSADISAAAGYTIKANGFVGKGTRVKLNQLLGK